MSLSNINGLVQSVIDVVIDFSMFCFSDVLISRSFLCVLVSYVFNDPMFRFLDALNPDILTYR